MFPTKSKEARSVQSSSGVQRSSHERILEGQGDTRKTHANKTLQANCSKRAGVSGGDYYVIDNGARTKEPAASSASSTQLRHPRSIKYHSMWNVDSCAHLSSAEKTERNPTLHKVSKSQLVEENFRASSGKKNEKKSNFCRVVELTEREHLILSTAEKWCKTITELSICTQKLHNVKIHLTRRSRKVHISGRHYHAGMKELLKTIKQATKWWEHQRNVDISVVWPKLRTQDVPLRRPTGSPKVSVNAEPTDTENCCKGVPTVSSSVPDSSPESDLEHVDVKPVIVFSSNEQMFCGRDETEAGYTQHIKVEPIVFSDARQAGDESTVDDPPFQGETTSTNSSEPEVDGEAKRQILTDSTHNVIKVEQDEKLENNSKSSLDHDISSPMSTTNTDHEGNNEPQEKVKALADNVEEAATVKVEPEVNSVSSDTTTQNWDSQPPNSHHVTDELRQDGSKTPTISERIQNLEPGHHFVTVVTKGPHKATAICIKPTPAGYRELFLKPGPSESVKYWFRLCLLHGKKHEFDVHIPIQQPVVVIMTRAEDFKRSFEIVMSYATKFGIDHYFRKDGEMDKQCISLGYEPILPRAADSLGRSTENHSCTAKFPDCGVQSDLYTTSAAAEGDSGFSKGVKDGVGAGPAVNSSCKYKCETEVQGQERDNLCEFEDAETVHGGDDQRDIVKASSCAEEKVLLEVFRMRGTIRQSSSRGRIRPSSSRGRIRQSSSRGRIRQSSSRGRIRQSSSRGRIRQSSSRGRIRQSSSRDRIRQSSSRGRIRPSSSRDTHINISASRRYNPPIPEELPEYQQEHSAKYSTLTQSTSDPHVPPSFPPTRMYSFPSRWSQPRQQIPAFRSSPRYTSGDMQSPPWPLPPVFPVPRTNFSSAQAPPPLRPPSAQSRRRTRPPQVSWPLYQQRCAPSCQPRSPAPTSAAPASLHNPTGSYTMSGVPPAMHDMAVDSFIFIPFQQMQSTQVPTCHPTAYYDQANASWQSTVAYSSGSLQQFRSNQPIMEVSTGASEYSGLTVNGNFRPGPNSTCDLPGGLFQENVRRRGAGAFEMDEVNDGNVYQNVRGARRTRGCHHGANIVIHVPRKKKARRDKKRTLQDVNLV